MKLENAQSPFLTFDDQASDPTTPSAGLVIGYFKSGVLYSRDSAGTVTSYGASGSVATDAIYDAKGDIPIGTGANASARLPVGTNGQVLTADSAETTGVKWSAAGAPSITWSTYTPTWDAATGTGPTLGNGTIAGYYADLGDVLLVRVSLKMGSTTTYGDDTNDWRFSLPATYTIANLPASGPRQALGTVYALDAGTSHVPGIAAGSVNTTNFQLYGPGSAGTGWKSSVPFTWATNDTISVNCLIHIA